MARIASIILVASACAGCAPIAERAPVARYRIINQITAYPESGVPSYQKFIAATGRLTIVGSTLELPTLAQDRTLLAEVRLRGERVILDVEGVTSEGTLNSWIKLKRTSSDGSSYQVWLGTAEPPAEPDLPDFSTLPR